VYIAALDVDGNPKILQSLISHAKQLEKSIYVLSVDPETDKVAHANYVAPSMRTKGADARKWSSDLVEVLGGKAGGKEDTAQGVGIYSKKVEEALTVAKSYHARIIS